MAKKLPQSVFRRNAGNTQIAVYHDSRFFAAAEGQKVPVAQRFLPLKMVSVFWCRFLPNCNMLFDCRISQIRTFPTGMTPSGLPFPFYSFPKIQNFFVFFDYPYLDPRKQKTGRQPNCDPQRERLPRGYRSAAASRQSHQETHTIADRFTATPNRYFHPIHPR